MADGLYQRHRPQRLEDVVGQPEAVRIVEGFGKKIPNVVIAIGPSGSGKTTTLRIMAKIIGCPPECTMDYIEFNCGEVDPIATVRRIGMSMGTSGLQSKSTNGGSNPRVYLLDEIQTFRRSKGAQEALLKILEDGPNHAYFFLGTTESKDILKTILGRCTQLPFTAIPEPDLEALIKKVAKAEKIEVNNEIISAIIDASGGSGRVALVELEKIAGIDDLKDKLSAISRVGVQKFGYDLAKELLPFKGASPSWPAIVAILKSIPKGEDSEAIRAVILGLAYVGLTEGKGREELAYKVIRCLDVPLYDRVSARALLAAACYKVVHGK